MTKKEALQILAILKAAYPASYNGMTKEEASGTVSVWAMQFSEMPADIVMMAIHKAIATNKFPPTVADVKEKIKAIHWEASDMVRGIIGESIPEGLQKEYQRIYDATADYRIGRNYEPHICGLLPQEKQLQIGGTENG